MLKGMFNVIDAEQMDRLHAGILNVLETTGLQIQGRFLLEALADAGCKVDFENHRAWFKPEVVEKQLEGQKNRYKRVRSSLWDPFCSELPEGDAAFPDEFAVDYGYATPWLLDLETGYRAPTRQDQVEMIRLGHALEGVRAVCAPLICSDVDSRVEILESARLLLQNTDKPGWVGTSCAREVKYLAELAALATGNDSERLRTRPPIFVHAYCTTSPLKLDTRSCEVLAEALKYGFPVNWATMPILGATTPVTPAGSVIVGAAEIIGGITATTLVDPEPFHYCTTISGEMDMRSTQVCYATPAAVLTDAALHQLFRGKYGLSLGVEPAYIEGRTPGIQTTFMKIFRQMAFASSAAMSLPVGLLDNATVFSPAQAMLDLDLNRAVYGFARGMDVNDETMCVDLINDRTFCEKQTYLESEHTLRHFREVLWDAKFFDRSCCDISEGKAEFDEDREMLAKADRAWREVLEAHEPIQRDKAFLAELDRIVEAGKKELLSRQPQEDA